MISHLYRGSVKDVVGPYGVDAPGGTQSAVVFEYSDAYSVFDWGKMPDLLPRKGEALAVLSADLFEKIEKPEIWKEFSRTPEALHLRKANRFGSVFNELGEDLQANGLRTHYLGALKGPSDTVSEGPQSAKLHPIKLSEVNQPFRRIAVEKVSVIKPALSTVLGRHLPDYYPTRSAPLPRLIPLEVVFRFGCPAGSSLLSRAEKDPQYMTALGFAGYSPEPGCKWDFPVLECFTKLESIDRTVALPEALAISGLSAPELQEILLRTAWLGSLLKWYFGRLGLELADGKLEWALSSRGKLILVDALGPDELRIMKGDVQLSKEFLRSYYKKSAWYASIEKAKELAKTQGTSDWKRSVMISPSPLPPLEKELASQVYMTLTNELTGRRWFVDAWGLEKIVRELKQK